MRWYFLGLVVVMLIILAVLPAECHAKGIFSFFNPEVTTPVTVQPVNSDITGGMKATITLGSLGSVITSHLALIIFGILLYAAICRVDGAAYHARVISLKMKRADARIERMRIRMERKKVGKTPGCITLTLPPIEKITTDQKSTKKRGGFDEGGRGKDI